VLLFLVFPLIQVPLLLRSSSGAGGPLAIDAGLAVLHVGSVFLIQIWGFLLHVAYNQVSRPYAGYLERAFHTPFNSGLFFIGFR
jgi:hypothetical protein